MRGRLSASALRMLICKCRCKCESGLARIYSMYAHTLALVKAGNQLSRSINVVALTLWNTIDVCSAFKQTQIESITLPHNIQAPSVRVFQRESEHVSINKNLEKPISKAPHLLTGQTNVWWWNPRCLHKTLSRCCKLFWTNSVLLP